MRKRTIEEIKNIIGELGYDFIDESKPSNSGGRKIIVKNKIGYKYDILLGHLIDKKRTIETFHKNNPYTLYNIKTWLKINNKKFNG